MIAKELGEGDAEILVLQARIMARRGLLDDAEKLARSALERGGESPVPTGFADPRFTLAEILARAARTEEARQAAEQSLRRYEAKGIVPLMEKARALLAEIPASWTASGRSSAATIQTIAPAAKPRPIGSTGSDASTKTNAGRTDSSSGSSSPSGCRP